MDTFCDLLVIFRVTANEGWYIHLDSGFEDTENIYKGAVALNANYDFSLVTIVPESELPEDAEILGGVTPDIETVTE